MHVEPSCWSFLDQAQGASSQTGTSWTTQACMMGRASVLDVMPGTEGHCPSPAGQGASPRWAHLTYSVQLETEPYFSPLCFLGFPNLLMIGL
jgi:hypothetical protein